MNDATLQVAMELLGVTPEDLRRALRRGPEALEALQRDARRCYRLVALELHPDRTGNDPDKTALFHAVSEALAEVENLRCPPRQRLQLGLVFKVGG